MLDYPSLYAYCVKIKNSGFMMKKEGGPLHFTRNFQHILYQIYFFGMAFTHLFNF